MFWRKVPPVVEQKNKEAEKLKAQILQGPKKVEKESQRLIDLLVADGITLKILYATGAGRRK